MEEKTEERGRGCMTTLCYIEKDDSYLMMHRTVKKNDVNKDKWIGVGGHAELGESPEECLLREVKEETGYTLTSWRFRFFCFSGKMYFCTHLFLVFYSTILFQNSSNKFLSFCRSFTKNVTTVPHLLDSRTVLC